MTCYHLQAAFTKSDLNGLRTAVRLRAETSEENASLHDDAFAGHEAKAWRKLLKKLEDVQETTR